MTSSIEEKAVQLVAPRTDAKPQADAVALADEVSAALRDLESSLFLEQAMIDRRGRAWSIEKQVS